jgi:hypothetical protein
VLLGGDIVFAWYKFVSFKREFTFAGVSASSLG